MKIHNNITQSPYLQELYFLYQKLRSYGKDNQVIMFHTGRCGSTVLSEMINQRNDIRWHGEIYEGYADNQSFNNRCKPLNYIKYLSYTTSSRNIGFEIKYLPYQHLRNEWLNIDLANLVLKLKNIGFNRFIILDRKNYLKRLVSQYIADEKKIWHSKKIINTKHQVRINPTEIWIGNTKMSLIEYFDSLSRERLKLKELLKPYDYLCLSYEDDIENNPFTGYNKVVNYLDLLNIDVDITLKKTNPFPLNEIILNFDEIHSYLINTNYKWMLE